MYHANQKLPWNAKGDFTLFKFVCALDKNALEDRLGFHKGRLSRGALICTMYPPDLANLTTSDFTLGASTRWSRSRSSVPWAPEFTAARERGGRMQPNAIESKLALDGQNVQELKAKVLKFLRSGGDHAPAKVFPMWQHEAEMQYPDAEVGVPQFMLHNKVSWIIVQILDPG